MGIRSSPPDGDLHHAVGESRLAICASNPRLRRSVLPARRRRLLRRSRRAERRVDRAATGASVGTSSSPRADLAHRAAGQGHLAPAGKCDDPDVVTRRATSRGLTGGRTRSSTRTRARAGSRLARTSGGAVSIARSRRADVDGLGGRGRDEGPVVRTDVSRWTGSDATTRPEAVGPRPPRAPPRAGTAEGRTPRNLRQLQVWAASRARREREGGADEEPSSASPSPTRPSRLPIGEPAPSSSDWR